MSECACAERGTCTVRNSSSRGVVAGQEIVALREEKNTRGRLWKQQTSYAPVRFDPRQLLWLRMHLIMLVPTHFSVP